jgi:hypothetical protein
MNLHRYDDRGGASVNTGEGPVDAPPPLDAPPLLDNPPSPAAGPELQVLTDAASRVGRFGRRVGGRSGSRFPRLRSRHFGGGRRWHVYVHLARGLRVGSRHVGGSCRALVALVLGLATLLSASAPAGSATVDSVTVQEAEPPWI